MDTKNRDDLGTKIKATVKRIAGVIKRTDPSLGIPPLPRPLDQTASPLLNLPAEIREIIWIALFSQDTKPAHFHIYDQVYDSCTYDAETAIPPRNIARRTAALRTCRMICVEATQILYDQAHFDLVVLAGLPRPDQTWESTGQLRRLADRNVLGSISECAQLRRIRHPTIVVQPGRKPVAHKYEQRVVALLEAIARGGNLRTLSIKFNVGRTQMYELDPRALQAFALTAKALASLIVPLPPEQRCTSMVLCNTGVLLGQPGREVDSGIKELQRALAIPNENSTIWLRLPPKDLCLNRGAHGTPSGPDISDAQVALFLVLFLAIAPLSIPSYIFGERKRKKAKGER